MSIEKESNGFPEANLHKRTTKVNMAVIVGVLIFFAAMFSVVWWFASSR
jgi:hypothetical protein